MKPSNWHQIEQVVAQQAFSSVSRHQSFRGIASDIPRALNTSSELKCSVKLAEFTAIMSKMY